MRSCEHSPPFSAEENNFCFLIISTGRETVSFALFCYSPPRCAAPMRLATAITLCREKFSIFRLPSRIQATIVQPSEEKIYTIPFPSFKFQFVLSQISLKYMDNNVIYCFWRERRKCNILQSSSKMLQM